jgi:hypothetical protein
MQNMTWLAGTRWYVTTENLLAYLTDSALRIKTPVADQTLWSITSAQDGSFQGTARTQLWVRAPDGGLKKGSAATNAIDGTVTESGEITIVFTPTDPGQAQTTGYGYLRQVDGEWRMEMQMATGMQSLALHWAYMTQWPGGNLPDAVPDAGLDGSLRSEEWRWLRGSTWDAVDQELFPDGADFAIDTYRNGYCWGEGAARDGSLLRMAGSVTPEGTLYLLFSVANAPAVARRGTIASGGGAYRMTWSPPSGGPDVGGATLAGDSAG